MSGRHLLDTNVLIALFRLDREVREKVGASTQLYVSVTVTGELYYGAGQSRHSAENVRRFEQFLATAVVLDIDMQTAQHYGAMKSALRAAGSPISENDLWIAASARRHGLSLVSRDAHFGVIPGLTVERW
jgi:tRNA(fMet)-specific endonuclease VapC